MQVDIVIQEVNNWLEVTAREFESLYALAVKTGLNIGEHFHLGEECTGRI